MNVFVAGASGAIGRPLVAELVRRGHAVTGMTRSEAGAEALADLGAAVARVSAFDAAVEQALRESQAEVVIDELTALPRARPRWPRPRRGTGSCGWRAAGTCIAPRGRAGCGGTSSRRAASSCGRVPGSGTSPRGWRWTPAPAWRATPAPTPSWRRGCWTRKRSRASSCGTGSSTGRAPGTTRTGRRPIRCGGSEVPIIGDGEGVWSWVHIDDAAVATADALTIPPGVYHVVDDDPSPVSTWLPAFARGVGAPPPPRVTVEQALAAAGEDAVYYGTRLRGASNAKAKRVFGFRPRRLEWLSMRAP